MNKISHRLASLLVEPRRALRQKMHPTVNIRIGCTVIVLQSIDDTLRLLRGSRIIQINQALALVFRPQDGEIPTNG